MFALNRRYPLFRKAVVVVFAVPLMFTGGSFLGELTQRQSVGEVGDLNIPRSEFISYYRGVVEQYRRDAGVDELPPQMLRAIQRQVQGNLLSEYLIRASLQNKGVRAPDSAVAAEIRNTPDFQNERGEFSVALYEEFVHDRRYYQERLREEIGRQPLARAMNGIPLAHAREQMARLQRQKRVVDEALVPVGKLTTLALEVPAEEVNLYYQRNAGEFAVREEADFEYFIVALDDFAATVRLDAGAAESAYEDFVADWDGQKRLRLRHIFTDDADDAAEIYELAAAADADGFAALARERSLDYGSALRGGDLGIVVDGDLPEEMSAAALTMSVGQVHAPVETEDGFSVMKVDEIIFAEPPAFAEVAGDMRAQARREAAYDDFEARVEELRGLAPVEIGSLAAMAAAAGKTVSRAGTVYANAEENAAPFNDEAALIDAFSAEVVADGENSAPIALGEDAYLFARAARYQREGRQPLEEVQSNIIGKLQAARLVAEMYAELDGDAAPAPAAADDAPSVLEQLKDVVWSRTHTVVYADRDNDEGGLDSAGFDDAGAAAAPRRAAASPAALELNALNLIYAADLTRGLPAYVFEPLEYEVRVFRIRAVEAQAPEPEDYVKVDEMLALMSERLSYQGYLDELSNQYRVEFYDLPDVALDGGVPAH